MGYSHIVREEFTSLNQLMDTLSKRKKNTIMEYKDSSNRDEYSFFGTKNYDEASNMLVNGYLDIMGQLKEDIAGKSKITAKHMANIPHPIPHTNITGYIPCVPNAILGLPNSMISVDRVPMKRKTLSITYVMGANASTRKEYFSEAGAALLSAINVIEKSGIQTQLKLGFFPGEAGDELVCPAVVIKNYGERYSLQKISFPLAHPSMFRRIGFRWLETSPDITAEGFNCGYGHVPDLPKIKDNMNISANTYYIDIQTIHRNN